RRTLAEPVVAAFDQPPFSASAMDGYAVISADVATLPAALNVIGEAAAGAGFAGTLGPGEAIRIFTGAPIPHGADAIIIQENTERDGDVVRVVDGAPDPAHVRPRGADFRHGETLLEAGHVLSPRTLTLAAAAGYGAVSVRRRPRVAVIATGDELVAPGTPPGPDQIVCSNAFGIVAMLARAGAEPQFLGIARDTTADLEAMLARAADADLVITIGGASVGDHDLVGPVLRSAGVTMDFWKIAMRPGKPLMFGSRGGQRFLGLPGNPVSALICARLFALALTDRMLGHDHAQMTPETAQLSAPLPANGARTHYMRAVSTRDAAGAITVSAFRSQDSARLAPLTAADVLIIRPPNAPAAAPGETVEILRIDF
ncbi:MAG: gephyrin-like molybdotransferase Glp, partial [Pseudomonadota bacterium]